MTAKSDPATWKRATLRDQDINFAGFRVVPGTEENVIVDRNGVVLSKAWRTLPEGYWLVSAIVKSTNVRRFNRVQIAYATGHGNKSKLQQLGAVILQAWKGPPPTPAHLAGHVNGVPDDDRLENLKWMTAQEVSDLRESRGTTAHGSRIRGGSGLRFEEEQVAAIKKIAAEYGVPGNLLAAALDMPQPRLSDILTGRTWARVTAEDVGEIGPDTAGGETVRRALDKKREQLQGKVTELQLCKQELFYHPSPGDGPDDSVCPVSLDLAREEAKFFGCEVVEV